MSSTIRVVNASHTCMLCGIVDLTSELRPTRRYRLPVPVCNPCWPQERRLLARERARRRAQARAREEANAKST
jgi:hypothetical protein